VYDFNAASGTVAARTPAPSAAGAGPRHIALQGAGSVATGVAAHAADSR